MKKQIIALILILALTVSAAAALTSCSGKEDKLTTTAASTAASVTQTETGNAATTAQRGESITNPTDAITFETASNQGGDTSSPPLYFIHSIDDMLRLENNIRTMNEEDLHDYLVDCGLGRGYVINSQQASAYLNEMKATYFPVLNGKDFCEMQNFIDDHSLRTNSPSEYGYYQFYIYTQPVDQAKYTRIAEGEKYAFAFEKECGDARIVMFSRLNKPGYAGNIFVGDRVITVWINESLTPAQLEEDIGRFSFVTVGDLMEQAKQP